MDRELRDPRPIRLPRYLRGAERDDRREGDHDHPVVRVRADGDVDGAALGAVPRPHPALGRIRGAFVGGVIGRGFVTLTLHPARDWEFAGRGSFHEAGPGVIESRGGPGILWYAKQQFGDFTLLVEWRLSAPTDNSGVFIRIPR